MAALIADYNSRWPDGHACVPCGVVQYKFAARSGAAERSLHSALLVHDGDRSAPECGTGKSLRVGKWNGVVGDVSARKGAGEE